MKTTLVLIFSALILTLALWSISEKSQSIDFVASDDFVMEFKGFRETDGAPVFATNDFDKRVSVTVKKEGGWKSSDFDDLKILLDSDPNAKVVDSSTIELSVHPSFKAGIEVQAEKGVNFFNGTGITVDEIK